MMKMCSGLGVALTLLGLSGCGDNSPTLVEVEGTVLLAGKPLEKVRVEFTPLIDGPQSAGLTNDQGKFSLATMTDQKKGAVVGKHKVVLKDLSIVQGEFMGRAGAEVDMTKGQKPRISTKYTNVTLTPLETDVTGEVRDLKFEVEPYKR
jgi:hypothetical protein